MCCVLYFYSKYWFRNLLTVTPTERGHNVKNGGLKQVGFSLRFASVHKESCKCSGGAIISLG